MWSMIKVMQQYSGIGKVMHKDPNHNTHILTLAQPVKDRHVTYPHPDANSDKYMLPKLSSIHLLDGICVDFYC